MLRSVTNTPRTAVRMLSVRFPEGTTSRVSQTHQNNSHQHQQHQQHQHEEKPKISQFKNPLLHCFLLASTTYICLQTVWYMLEYQQREADLVQQTSELERKIQQLVDAKKASIPTKRWFEFWK